jgi:hypothetical protein
VIGLPQPVPIPYDSRRCQGRCARWDVGAALARGNRGIARGSAMITGVQEESKPRSLRRRNEENDWPIRLMSLIFGQMIMGAATARANGDPQMHKFVAKVTGVLCRAKGVSAGLCQKQADRGLTRLQVRSEERVTDSLEFELFQRLLNERRNFTICCD